MENKMKILVVEDETKTASFLKKGLTEGGFTVDVAEDGDEGLNLALHGGYDLIILDVMLPGRDGWSVMSELRRSGKQTLCLFLSARDSIPDRVKGLDLGADGYLSKPFAFSELMAQIRSLLRRGPSRQTDTLKIADLELDFLSHHATRGNTRLELTPKEFALLSLLARKSGDILSRTLISDQVWGMNFDSDSNTVDVHIRRLRAKVDDPFESKLIHTVRGVGYVLKKEEPGKSSGDFPNDSSGHPPENQSNAK
jgi:two-component system copper resistance phosphate regulon response regulator CusR